MSATLICDKTYVRTEEFHVQAISISEPELELCAFRRTLTRRYGKRKPSKVIVHEGICKQSELSRVHRDLPRSTYQLVYPEYLEEIGRWGLHPTSDSRLMDMAPLVIEKPFEAATSGLLPELMLAWFYYDGGMVFADERMLEPYPMAIGFDYMDGWMNNSQYELGLARAILETRDDVFDLSGLKDVPRYNQGGGAGSYYIHFTWRPCYDVMQELWAKAKELDKRFPTTKLREAAFEIDALGLRKSGASKYGTFFHYPEKRG